MQTPTPFTVWADSHGVERFLHGTKAELKIGELIVPGRASNYEERTSVFAYFTGTLDAATWGAELAKGEGAATSTSSSRLGRTKTIQT